MFIRGFIDKWTNVAPCVHSSPFNSTAMIEFLLLYNEVSTPCLVLLAYVSQVNVNVLWLYMFYCVL